MFNQKIITIILARGGSKGLYKKNLRLLNNEPLITRAIRHVKESGISSEILVSTDDEEISNIAKQSGAIVPFIRPEDLSGDLTTTEDSLKHALIEFEKLKKIKFDIGVFITVTDIFRDPIWIKEAVDILINNPKIESVFSGHKTHKNFWEKDKNGKWIRLRDWMATYSSRQIRTPIVREDTGLACASRAYLWREGRRIGDSIEIITNDDDFTSIDIHNLEDLLLAEAALKIRKKKSIS
tara:strand:- start:103 stop:816 length:714 start_codon:yes stop_codon:yes gene_type:complete